MTAEIRTVVVSTRDDQIGRAMTMALEKGWQILYAPIYLYDKVPHGFNSAVVGPSPHFLLVMQKNDSEKH